MARLRHGRDPEEPPAAERSEIERSIAMCRLWRRDRPGVVDWQGIAGRLADELAAMAARFADCPVIGDADLEQIDRAGVVLTDYRIVEGAATVEDEDTLTTLPRGGQRRHGKASVTSN